MNPDAPNLPHDLLLEHADGMRRLAQRLVRDPALAEDVAQDAVLVALSRGPRSWRNLRGWLNGIVRNVARQSRRSAQRRTRHEGAVPAPDAAPDPLARVAQIAEHKRLLDAVETLPEPYRETVWQRYFEDRKPRTIARDAGISVETVRTRLKRAHALLRTKLDRAHGGDRRAWALALAPLGASGGSWALPALIGGALVTTKTKVGALLALLLLAAGSAWWIAVAQQGPGDVEPSALPPAATAQVGLDAGAPTLRGSGPAPGAVAAEATAGPWHVEGRTLSPADEPLADIELRAAPPEVQDIEAMPVVARSQADGRFVFSATGGAESLRIVASAPGRLDAVARRRREEASPLALVLPTVPSYAFRVLDGTTDEPLVGVTCTLRRKEGALLWERVVRSDAAGVMVVPGPTANVLEDKLSVIVRHPGYRTLMQLPRPLDSSRGRPRDLYLFGAPHLVLEARDPEGNPVAGVRIRAWAGQPSLSTAPPEWRMDTLRFWVDGSGHGVALGDALTDGTGRVIFDMGPEGLTWFAHAAAEGLAGMVHGSTASHIRDVHVVIPLETTVRIVGRVTDAAGQPVARARVACTPWAIAEAMKKGGVPLPPDECARHWETMTNAAGEYELAAVPLPAAPAEVFLGATRGDIGTAHAAVRAGSQPNATQRIDLVLAGGLATATIHVVDDQGRPLAGALVTFAHMLPGMLTDETGSARLVLHPGVDGPFRAYKHGYLTGSAEPSDDKGAVTVTLGRSHVLRGRVLDKDGEPRGAYVDVYDPKVADLPESERNQLFTDLWFGRAHTDGDGYFRLDEMPAGPYFVRAWCPARRGGEHVTVVAEQHVAGDAPALLRLPEAEPPQEPTGVLAGTVVGADGEPLTAYAVSLQTPRGASAPDLRGRRFRFEAVVPGTWTLTAGSADGTQKTELRVVVRAGEQTDVRVVLAPSLILRGRLVDEAGKGIAGTQVQLVRGAERDTAGLRRTDAEGRFTMDDLLPGTYRARVRLAGGEQPYIVSNDVFEVQAGHREEVVLQARPGATLALDLDDERFLVHSATWHEEVKTQRGQRSWFSRVAVTTAAGEELVEVGLFHGRRRFPFPLAPGRHDLLVTTLKEGSFRTSFSIAGDKQTIVPVVLEKE